MNNHVMMPPMSIAMQGGPDQQSFMGPGGPGQMYPPGQPMVFNPNNPTAPPIYPCALCHKEVKESDEAIMCESGCNFWYHRECCGLTPHAFQFIKQQPYAEWVCDECVKTKQIPLVKLKP